ncbi:hypothetical protein ATCC90586_001220 [Pythium insidiosum]|nr:hypothetical protein ATCC90586_001220 [Pythium insidiosum]
MATVELKRKWKEVDWEVVMAAQSFVAVFAAGPDDEQSDEGGDSKAKAKKTKARKKKASASAAKKKKAPPVPTRALRRRGAKRAKADAEAEAEEGGDGDGDGAEGGAEDEKQKEEEKESTQAAGFWLAELQDDVTEEMLECETGVRITWLNQRPHAPARYDYAYDDIIDVQSILCHVYLREWDDGSFELTPKSLKRVQRSLARSRGEVTDENNNDDDDDDEKPPTTRRKRRAATVDDDGADDDDRPRRRRGGASGGGGRASRGSGQRKLSKREEAMHIRPRYTTVDASKYEDTEIYGTHSFAASSDDVMSNSKEVIRAVVTKNHKMLKKLTGDKTVYKQLHSFSVKQSVDVKRTALHRAIEMDDLTAAGILIKAHTIEQKQLAKKPEVALPSHSTGKHTSAYSDYNRRAINASRGGREGNNALTEDSDGSVLTDENSFLWEYNALHFALLKVDLNWHHDYDSTRDDAQIRVEKEEGTYEEKKKKAFLKYLSKIPHEEADPVETLSNLASIPGVNLEAQDILGRTPLHLAAAIGSIKRVHGELDTDGNVILGEEFDALLTKVDVKNGPYGSNVFYRCQIVHDQIQDIYVVFTNWGRIGEEGKYQNTPFHSAAEAIVEFKKIFKSKTGNNWEDRHEFVKHNKRYNLIQRVNYHTKISEEVTSPFTASKESDFVASKLGLSSSVMEMLFAITDVRNLQLAATEDCSFHDSLPLADADELRSAIDRLIDIRELIQKRKKVEEEMQTARGDISDEASNKLAELSETHTNLTEDISEKSSRYYEVMPCNEDAFGSPIKGFDDVAKVNQEIVRLRLIIDITHTYKMLLGAKLRLQTIHPLDYCYNAMQVHLAALPQDSAEVELLTKYFFNGIRRHERSKYRLSNIFEVSRRGEKERILATAEESGSLRQKHHQLLWHGTKRTNLMGILSQGLRIAPPEVPHQGYMYGKGLYFANVTAKSLSYCDAAYVITSTKQGNDGIAVKKTRDVHYLLLCEVAMGTPTRVTQGRRSTMWGQQVDGAESVYAMGRHVPDPIGSIVSPQCGAALSLGKVGEIGVAFPFDSVWAKTECDPQPWNYYDRNTRSDEETLELWDRLVDRLDEGEKYEVEDNDEKKLFFSYYYERKSITVELLQKKPAKLVGDTINCCDASIKITVKDGNNPTFSWQARRYRNAFGSSTATFDDVFTWIRPNLAEYDELIVYNEGQARIRYLVEVESV